VVEHYDEMQQAGIHTAVYLANNYYTFSYALSQSSPWRSSRCIRRPREVQGELHRLSLSRDTMTPPEKLRKFFGIEIDRKLFEDAMDVVKMRVKQLEELEGK
jgi:oligoendopeptidase F